MKYGVLKLADVLDYCSEESKRSLDKIVEEITGGRIKDGKKTDNTYVVVNTDEEYAAEVIEIIENHIGEKISFGEDEPSHD